MRPILLEVPLWDGMRLVFPAYGTFLIVGFLAAFLIGRKRVEAIGLSSDQLFNMGYLSVLAGVFGAHLLHVALHLDHYFEGSLAAGLWRTVAFWQGGLSYYGGLAGGVLALSLYARWKGVATIDVLDFVAPLGAIGLAFTRYGCFLNGCCYGGPSELPWAVSFPAGSQPQVAQVAAGLVGPSQASLPIHPTQLYELLVAAAIAALLWAAWPRRRFRGEIVVLFFLLYAPWRFLNELLRADTPAWRPWGLSLGGLNVYQALSVLLFVAALGAWRVLSRRQSS